jgi:peptide/nickel transport system substrate-binding protein
MARRIRWQLLIAAISSLLVLGLMAYLAIVSASVARPVSGGAYVEGTTALPRQLNPLAEPPTADLAAAEIQALVFDGLMRISPDGRPEPALAQGWEADEAGLVYTFTLRANVAWHDGAPFTTDDVLFTLQTIQGPAFAGDPSIATVWRDVLVDQVGERTIRCRLQTPFAPLLRFATFPVLPAHLLRDVPPEQWATAPFSRAPVGTGPYRLDELSQDRVLLRANPQYFAGAPFLESIELRRFPNEQTAFLALTRGEIGGLSFPAASELGAMNMPRNVVRHTAALDGYSVLTFNIREAPLNDQGLRRALALALDKDLLIDQALDGQASRLDTPILPGWLAATPDVIWYPADGQQAADVLDSLGYERGPDGMRARDGQPLRLTLITDGAPDRIAVAQEIARQWNAAGVMVEIQQLDAAALQTRLAAHDFTLALHGWTRLGADPDVLELWHSAQAEGGLNYAGLRDEQVDELLENARLDVDPVSRAATYAAFQQRWIELVPSITLYQPQLVYAATSDLRGLAFGEAAGGAGLLFGREGRFAGVQRWYIRSAREIRGDLRQGQ